MINWSSTIPLFLPDWQVPRKESKSTSPTKRLSGVFQNSWLKWSGKSNTYFSKTVIRLTKNFRNQFPIKQTYLDAIAKSYNATAQNLDFDKATESAQIMNDFVKEQTRGKISEIVKADSISREFLDDRMNNVVDRICNAKIEMSGKKKYFLERIDNVVRKCYFFKLK